MLTPKRQQPLVRRNKSSRGVTSKQNMSETIFCPGLLESNSILKGIFRFLTNRSVKDIVSGHASGDMQDGCLKPSNLTRLKEINWAGNYSNTMQGLRGLRLCELDVQHFTFCGVETTSQPWSAPDVSPSSQRFDSVLHHCPRFWTGAGSSVTPASLSAVLKPRQTSNLWRSSGVVPENFFHAKNICECDVKKKSLIKTLRTCITL